MAEVIQAKRQELLLSDKTIKDIVEELRRQDIKWGDQRDHDMTLWMTILTEEVGELAEAILSQPLWFGENIRSEAIQVIAVCVRILQQEDFNKQQVKDDLARLNRKRTEPWHFFMTSKLTSLRFSNIMTFLRGVRHGGSCEK